MTQMKYMPLPQTTVLMVERFRFIKVKNGEERGNIKFNTLGMKIAKVIKGKCMNEK